MTATQWVLFCLYPLSVGVGLGGFYYGGLWLVLRRLPQLKHPAIWMGLSLTVRTAGVVLLLYLLFASSWQQLILAVTGMLISRILLIQRVKAGAGHHYNTAG